MKEFKSKPLIGLSDLSDERFSLSNMSRIENGKQTIKSNSSYEGRSKGGQTNKKTGHISKLGKEWGSIIGKKYGSKNIIHCKTKQAIEKSIKAKSTPIEQLTISKKLIKKWDSMNDAKRAGYHAGHISECCNGLKKQYKGFIWRFA